VHSIECPAYSYYICYHCFCSDVDYSNCWVKLAAKNRCSLSSASSTLCKTCYVTRICVHVTDRSCRSVDNRRCCCCCWQSPVGHDERRGTARRQRHARMHRTRNRLLRCRAIDSDAITRQRCRPPSSPLRVRVRTT